MLEIPSFSKQLLNTLRVYYLEADRLFIGAAHALGQEMVDITELNTTAGMSLLAVAPVVLV